MAKGITAMKVLLLSPHTDDVELSAGATLAKLSQDKSNTFAWAVFSTCEDAVPQGWPSDTLKKEFTAVASKCGIGTLYIYNFPNKNFPEHRQEIMDNLDQIKQEFKPDLIIAPSLNDSHQDHKTIAEESIRVFKKDTSIIGYEMPWSNLIFQPQLFVRVTPTHMEMKWSLLQNYKSQFTLKRNYFSKEFIFGWARMRGVQCNSEYAEAFEVIRWIT